MFYAYVEKQDSSIWRKWEMRIVAFDTLRRHLYCSAPLPKDWAAAVSAHASDETLAHSVTTLSTASVTSSTTMPLFAATQPSESALTYHARDTTTTTPLSHASQMSSPANPHSPSQEESVVSSWRTMPAVVERVWHAVHRPSSHHSSSQHEGVNTNPAAATATASATTQPSVRSSAVTSTSRRTGSHDDLWAQAHPPRRALTRAESHPVLTSAPHRTLDTPLAAVSSSSSVSQTSAAASVQARASCARGNGNDEHRGSSESLISLVGAEAGRACSTPIRHPTAAACAPRQHASQSSSPNINSNINNNSSSSSSSSNRNSHTVHARVATPAHSEGNTLTADAFAAAVTGGAGLGPHDDEVWPGGPRLSQVVWRKKIKLIQILPAVMGKRFHQKGLHHTRSESAFFEFVLIGETRVLDKGEGPPREPLLCASTALHRSAFPAFPRKPGVPTCVPHAPNTSSPIVTQRMNNSMHHSTNSHNTIFNTSSHNNSNNSGRTNYSRSMTNPLSQSNTPPFPLPPTADHHTNAVEDEFLYDPAQLAELDSALRELQFRLRHERQRVVRAAQVAGTALPDFLARCATSAMAMRSATLDSPRAQSMAYAGSCEGMTLRCRSEYEACRLWFVMQSLLGSDGLTQYRPFDGRPPHDPRNGVCFAAVPLTLIRPFGAVLNKALFYVLERGWVVGWSADGTRGALCAPGGGSAAAANKSCHSNPSQRVSSYTSGVQAGNVYDTRSLTSKVMQSPIAAYLVSFSLSSPSSTRSPALRSCYLCIMHDDVLIMNEKAQVCGRVEMRRIREVHMGGLALPCDRRRHENKVSHSHPTHDTENGCTSHGGGNDDTDMGELDSAHWGEGVSSSGSNILRASERRRGDAWRSSKRIVRRSGGNNNNNSNSNSNNKVSPGVTQSVAKEKYNASDCRSASQLPPGLHEPPTSVLSVREPFIALRSDAPGPDIIFTPLPPHTGARAQSHYCADFVARRIYTVLHDLCFASVCVRRVIKMAVVEDANAMSYVRRVERGEDVTRERNRSLTSANSMISSSSSSSSSSSVRTVATTRASECNPHPRHPRESGNCCVHHRVNEANEGADSISNRSQSIHSQSMYSSSSTRSSSSRSHSDVQSDAAHEMQADTACACIHDNMRRSEASVTHAHTQRRSGEVPTPPPLHLPRQEDWVHCHTLTESLCVPPPPPSSSTAGNEESNHHSPPPPRTHAGSNYDEEEERGELHTATESSSASPPHNEALPSIRSIWHEYAVLMQSHQTHVHTTGSHQTSGAAADAPRSSAASANMPNYVGLPLYTSTAADWQLRPQHIRQLNKTLSRRRVEQDEVVGMPLHRVHQLLLRDRHSHSHRHSHRHQRHRHHESEQPNPSPLPLMMESSPSPSASCHTMQYVDIMSRTRLHEPSLSNDRATQANACVTDGTLNSMNSDTPDSNALAITAAETARTTMTTATIHHFAPVPHSCSTVVIVDDTSRVTESATPSRHSRCVECMLPDANADGAGRTRRGTRHSHRRRRHRGGGNEDRPSYAVPGARYLTREEMEHATQE